MKDKWNITASQWHQIFKIPYHLSCSLFRNFCRFWRVFRPSILIIYLISPVDRGHFNGEHIRCKTVRFLIKCWKRAQREDTWPTKSAGKHVKKSQDWCNSFFWLVDEMARVFTSQSYCPSHRLEIAPLLLILNKVIKSSHINRFIIFRPLKRKMAQIIIFLYPITL